MKEVKFRAWCKKEKGYISGFNMCNYHGYFNKGLKKSISRYSNEWNEEEYILEQYTGLKDKKDVEIYEGDIVKCLHDDWASKSNSDKRTINEYRNDLAVEYEIGFKGGFFCMYYKRDKELIHYIRGYHNHGFIEVIGNIHKS